MQINQRIMCVIFHVMIINLIVKNFVKIARI